MTMDSSTNALQSDSPPTFATHFLFGMGKRFRLILARLRHPRVCFGEKCDVRKRFVLRQNPAGRVEFGEACVLDNDLTIECLGSLSVGKRVIFGHHCTLAARDNISIGDDCMIAEMVSIRDHDHAFSSRGGVYREQGFVCAPVCIGKNVWLGGKVTVCKGVTIGNNSVIGANAVVTKDIPANCIAAGVPARIIRQLVPRLSDPQ